MEELTYQDCRNIAKWVTSTSIMIEAGVRTPWSESELDTWEKIKNIERSLKPTVVDEEKGKE